MSNFVCGQIRGTGRQPMIASLPVASIGCSAATVNFWWCNPSRSHSKSTRNMDHLQARGSGSMPIRASSFLSFSGAFSPALVPRPEYRRHSFCTFPICRLKHSADSTPPPRRRTALRLKNAESRTLENDSPPKTSAEESSHTDGSAASSNVASTTSELLSSTISRGWAFVLLNVVTVLWGSQHAIIKLSMQADSGLSPAELNLDRFLIAAIIFLPFSPKVSLFSSTSPDTNASRTTEGYSAASATDEALTGASSSALSDTGKENATWLAGLELGFWMFAGYAMQAVGLQYTTASRSAFLLYLNVKLVPIFASVLYGRRIDAVTWASAATAVAGTALLGYDGSPPNVGDAWSVAAAAASALFILRLETAARRFPPAKLNAAAMVGVAALCSVWVLLAEPPADWRALLPDTPMQAAAAAYLGVVTTALTNLAQTVGQRAVPAERAALIYALDPVYAAGFAYALLGERLGPQGLVGAGLLLAAAAAGQVFAAPGGGGKGERE